jgi:MHS family alpha-ketoglutarate permease-like MFS transporter
MIAELSEEVTAAMSIHERAGQATSVEAAPPSGSFPPATRQARAHRRRTILATGAGNALEWYDWNVYAVFAPFFASQFFSSNEPISALLSTLAVFAVGFVMRPLGGYAFGWLADRHGRRLSMLASVGLAAGGSLLIGIAPTYGAIGVFASVGLLLARLMQGLAHGGEIAAGHTYIAEVAPAQRRGLWSSVIYVSGMAATLFAMVLGASMTSLVSEEQMTAWGWRVPFIVGGALGLVVIYLRRRLEETTAFAEESEHQAAKPQRPSVWRGVWANRTAALQVIGLTVGGTVFFYTWAVAAPAYAIGVKGMNESDALWAGVIAIAIMIAFLPLAGALSDRFGRKPSFLGFSVAAAALTFPLNRLIQGELWQLALATTIALLLMALAVSILPALFAELFPTNVRAAGIGLPYSLAVALTGGTAPYLQTWLSTGQYGDLFLGYTVVLLLVGAVVTLKIPETKARPLQ